MVENILLLKRIKFSVMFLMGVVMIIFPDSLITILLFVLGLYMVIIGVNALISALTLLKFKKGWIYEGTKFVLLSFIGVAFLFNSVQIAAALSGFIFVIFGLLIISAGITAIVRTREYSAGVVFIIVGLLIALFPLGVSHFVTRIIGLSLTALSVSLLVSLGVTSS